MSDLRSRAIIQMQMMLESRVFVVRPRAASLLRFFVEESFRNGGAPIDQRSIAIHAHLLPEDFEPGKSAYVRAHVSRLRKALRDYYESVGRDDPIVFGITGGPYRLIVKEAGRAASASKKPAGGVATDSVHQHARSGRRNLPTVLLVAHDAAGCPADAQAVGEQVVRRLATGLIDCPFVTACGPVLCDRIAAESVPLDTLAAQWGYDYMAVVTIRLSIDSGLSCSATVIDVHRRKQVFSDSTTVGPEHDQTAADGVADWLHHRISEAFMAMRTDSGSLPLGGERSMS
jgi:hypothetical protein